MFYTSIKIVYTQQTACHMSFDLKQVIQTYMQYLATQHHSLPYMFWLTLNTFN